MKVGWEIKKLGDICEIRNGRNQREVESPDGEFPIYGSAGTVMGMASSYICDAGATIIGRKGNINSPVYATTPFWNVDTAFGLVAKEELHSRFLYFFCLSYDFSTLNRGTTIPSLVKSELKEIPVPIPPLSEQAHIVGILDEAFASIATAKANTQRNLENAKAVFESHLNSVFSIRGEGWVEKKLGEVCEMYQPKTISTKDLVPDGPYKVFGANGIIGRYDKFNHAEPQLLITCRGATCGSVNISEPNCWITGNAMVVKPSVPNLNLGFLEFAFRGGIEISKAITGAAQPQITRTNLIPLTVSFPKALEEQERLCQLFREIREESDRLTSLYTQKLSALEDLKKSLLHQAFTGKL